VADNFYFLGTKIHSAWALVGSDGIIIFEALFDYAAPDEIADGMRKLGLDINKVKYVVLSHAHADHDGGARYLQDKMPSAHLVYGGPDWDAVDKSTNHAGGKPKHDLVGANGMKSQSRCFSQIVTTQATGGALVSLFEVRTTGSRALSKRACRRHRYSVRRYPPYYDGYIGEDGKLRFGATALVSNPRVR
jgi:metallo-beta-lactamase class B